MKKKKYPFKIGKLNEGFAVWEQVLWDREKKDEKEEIRRRI